MNYLIEDFVKPKLAADFGPLGYESPADIAYLQWGSPLLTGASLNGELSDPLGFYPEFWAYYNRTLDVAYSLNISNSRALLSGAYNFSDAVSVGTFMAFGLAGDAATINLLFGSKLTSTDVTMLLGYLAYLGEFVDNFIVQPIFDLGGGLVTTHTVDEWLWTGTDPFLTFLEAAGQVDSDASNLFTNHVSMEDAVVQEEGKSDKWYTGSDDVNDVGEYIEYEESATVDELMGMKLWESDETISGTDGTQFHPGVEPGEDLFAWVAEIMRVIKLVNLDKLEVEFEGITLLRYTLADEVLGVDTNFHQTIKGLGNMTAAKGFPLFVSKPHFLDGDASLRDTSKLEGLAPVAADHDLFVDVEPISGLTMNARKRLQINLGVSAGDWYSKNVTEVFLPLVWIEEGATISDSPKLAKDFKDDVYGAQDLQDNISLGGPVVGILLLALSGFIAVRAVRSSKP